MRGTKLTGGMNHLKDARDRVYMATCWTTAIAATLVSITCFFNPDIPRSLITVGAVFGLLCFLGPWLKPNDPQQERFFLIIFSFIITAIHIWMMLDVQLMYSAVSTFLIIGVIGITLVGGRIAGRISATATIGAFVASYLIHHRDEPIQHFENGQFIDWTSALIAHILVIIGCFICANVFRSAMIRTTIKLDEARRLAQSASEAKTTFLANMSHEIRTPMNGVMGMLDEVLGRDLDPDVRQDLEVASRSAQSLLGILNDILDFSKLQAGELTIEPVATRTTLPFVDVTSLFTPVASAKGLALRFEAGADLPSLVQMDSLRVRQILSNLVGNAVKFTEKGHIVLRLDHADDMLRIEVEDTGIGIAEDKLSVIFDRFGQARSELERRYDGAGLGLAISKHLVEAMGGSICLESQLGVGTTFFISLPAAEAFTPSTEEIPSDQQPEEKDSDIPLRVLVAEDNVVNQLVLKRFFERLGHHVTMVNDGEDAVEAAGAVAFDVFILDVSMERMDGITAARTIQQQPGLNQDTPVILATAFSERDIAENMADVRIDSILMKPLQFDSLKAVLHETAEKQRETAAA